MTRDALLRALRAYASENDMAFDWNPSAGKGGHGKLRVGGGRTIVKSGELRPLDIERMLKQLGLPKDALK